MPACSGTIRRWLVDAGVGQHIVVCSNLSKQQLASAQTVEAISVVTANGVIKVDQVVDLWVDELGFSDSAYILPGSPPALSACRLCSLSGCSLVWPEGADVATLTTPSGKEVVITTIAHCPYLLSRKVVLVCA